MKKLLVAVIAGIGVLVLAIVIKESTSGPSGGGPMERPQMSAPVEVSSVESVVWSISTEAVGTAYADESIDVTASVSDIVETIRFAEGQRTKAGDVLVELNSSEEQAELESARTNLAEQEREVERLRGLVASRSVSQSLLDERLTMRETAKHQLAVVQARLRDRTIRAPFDGVLGLRHVSVGSYVSPGVVITTLDAIDTIKLDFSIPAVHLGNLSEGMEVVTRTPAYPNHEFTGVVRSIDSRVNPVNRSLTLRAELPNPDLLLKPGMLLHVTLAWEDQQVLTVPETAIIQNKDQHFVYVVTGEKPTARMQEVTIGVRRPGVVEIREGLQEGDVVVSRGTNTVRDGGAVKVVNSEDVG